MDKNKRPLRRPPNTDMSICIGNKKVDISDAKSRLNETTMSTFAVPKGVGNMSRRKMLSKNAIAETPNPAVPAPMSNSKTLVSELRELEMEYAYNEYLQALIKETIVDEKIVHNKATLEGQLQYYRGILKEKEQTLNDIKEDTGMMDKQREIVEALKILELKIDQMKSLYMGQQIGVHIEKIHKLLEEECGKVWLKNVKPITTREEQDRFIEVLKKLHLTLDKILSGELDFEGKPKLLIAYKLV